MKKHKHYQQIRAYADGWKVECLVTSTRWDPISNPSFLGIAEYRIVPDEDGWIPWYPHEGANCPLDGPIEIMLACGDTETIKNWCWWDDKNVTHYRPAKPKRDRILEVINAWRGEGIHTNKMLDEIMEIVEE